MLAMNLNQLFWSLEAVLTVFPKRITCSWSCQNTAFMGIIMLHSISRLLLLFRDLQILQIPNLSLSVLVKKNTLPASQWIVMSKFSVIWWNFTLKLLKISRSDHWRKEKSTCTIFRRLENTTRESLVRKSQQRMRKNSRNGEERTTQLMMVKTLKRIHIISVFHSRGEELVESNTWRLVNKTLLMTSILTQQTTCKEMLNL